MSKMYQVEVAQEFEVPVEQLFAHLSEHENMRPLFAPARVTRVRDGTESRNGIGSARRVKPGPMPSFIETVTDFRENELVEYRITCGSPLRDHVGTMHFRPCGQRSSTVKFDIRFEGAIPGAGPLFRFILARGIKHGLARLAESYRSF